MSPWIIVILALVVGFMIFAFMGTKESKKAGEKAGKLLGKIEDKYNDYVDRELTQAVLREEQLSADREKILEELSLVLKPDIEALIAFINSTVYSGARTNYQARYLSNIPHVVNELFEKSRKSKESVLDTEDERRLYEAFRTGIKSDLTQRLNNLESGFL